MLEDPVSLEQTGANVFRWLAKSAEAVAVLDAALPMSATEFFMLRASRRGGNRESFRESFHENSSKNLILQIFRTRRTLGDVENYLLSKFRP